MSGFGIERIALVTDFGSGIYLGQMTARLTGLLPRIPVIDLVHDLPPFRPDLAAYLLPAIARDLPARTLYLCVVDPGVGGERHGLVVESDGLWLVGPDNGLLSRVLMGRSAARAWHIRWRPEKASPSFHGRDWFAPVAARLVGGCLDGLEAIPAHAAVGADWGDELPAVIYVDRYGNLMTGLRAASYAPGWTIVLGRRRVGWARTFCSVPAGEAFWYENALGLVEIAVNRGRADRVLGLAPGDPVALPVAPGR